MWLKLTNFDGKPVRVNMNMVSSYFTSDKDGGKTFLEYPVSNADSYEGVHIQETLEQLDALVFKASW